jgi:hypothetical protein
MNRVNGMQQDRMGCAPEGKDRALDLPLGNGSPKNGTENLANRPRECPVGAEGAAAFLKIARSTAMALARAGKIPAHPVTNGRRKRWLFFISELDAYVRGLGVNYGSHPCA